MTYYIRPPTSAFVAAPTKDRFHSIMSTSKSDDKVERKITADGFVVCYRKSSA